ncbi:hypothetical protein AYO21_03179 [Fonsecaea monophora]|uniref:ATP-grasp domain-containing protein n=1 Tax=Fonsecaea monophora TaxID=254056 RepID=A0A177FE78_9EURO|nr:hypothetical protein AYO21_03179 [Fonsecaea monophora]OAG42594.1 hypothetical protein AYO21_03179 [Fonsecaea monophora]
MLQRNSPLLAHRLQNASLLILSLVFLPLDTLILLVSLVVGKVFPSKVISNREAARHRDASFTRRKVLVTGVGMSKGLALARLFYEAGHDVIGADFEPDGAWACGRVSSALGKFYRLEKPDAKAGAAPYIQTLLDVVTKEKVELWISCSGVASAVEDGMAKEVVEARTACKAVQFDVQTTQTLHEKHSFMAHTRDVVGLTVPETHEVASREAVLDVLRAAAPHGRKYIMKTIGVDDAVRGDLTLLPKKYERETVEHLARLNISKAAPWILQEFIQGREYCTHALVMAGKVKAFVACPSAELLMHYQALPAESPLSRAMLAFTRKYAASGGRGFTGHLSFDFMVREDQDGGKDGKGNVDPRDIVLYPIECNPRAHTAVVLFNGRTGTSISTAATAMVQAYLSIFEDVDHHHLNRTADSGIDIVHPVAQEKYFWTGHDLVTLVLLPTLSLFFALFSGLASVSLPRSRAPSSTGIGIRASITHLTQNYTLFLHRLLTWRDGTYEPWDPLPWWWLYHVYWPVRFWACLRDGRKWSRINVSTAKMFEC